MRNLKLSFIIFLFFTYWQAQGQDFIININLGPLTMIPATNSLSFGVTSTGLVNYTWETIPAGQSGGGIMAGPNATLYGFPLGAIIKLKIDTTNLRALKFENIGPRVLDIQQWGGVHWANMEESFSNCRNMIVSAIDTPDFSNVTSMRKMFFGCEFITNIPNINTWNTSNVTDMSSMFETYVNMGFINGLFNSPIENWNTNNVTDMSRMFYGAKEFNQPIGTWNTANVTDMRGMFSYAYSFNQPIGTWNTANVTNMSDMFSGTYSFNQAIGAWNTASVTDMKRMFLGAYSFNQPIGTWNTMNVIDMRGMFSYANSFNQPIGTWNTTNVNDMSYMFYNSMSFNQPIGNWNTTNVTGMSGMFSGAQVFNQPINNWNTTNVTNTLRMFENATSFNQSIDNWDTSNDTIMEEMFINAASFNQPIGNWNTSNVKSMNNMFNSASSFNQPIGNWNISNVKSMSRMFMNASSFNQPIGNWNVSNVTNLSEMFYGASSFNQPIGNWNTQNVIYFGNTFKNATSFNQFIGNWKLSSGVGQGFIDSCGMDCNMYSENLIGFSSNPNIVSNITIKAGNLQYGTSAQSSRNTLILSRGWTIIGDTSSGTNCTEPQFITIWDLSVAGSSANQISFEVSTTGICTYTWETIPAGTSGIGTFTGSFATISGLPSGATIRLSIDSANLKRFRMNNGIDRNRLIEVKNWGAANWAGMESAFAGCSNLTISCILMPDLTNAISLDSMFMDCTNLNGPINIQYWDISNVESINSMFENAINFNQNLWNWNTSSITSMKNVFRNCIHFNQPIGSWNTSMVTNMSFLLSNASSFNQDLSFWNLNSVTNLNSMLDSCGMDCVSYSATLNGWNNNLSLPNNLTLNAAGLEYGLNALSSRDNLILAKGWNIIGDSPSGQNCPNKYFITKWDMSLPGLLPSNLKFGIEVIGSVNYHWETIPAGQSGHGSFSGYIANVSGLPAGATIRLSIDTAYFNRIRMDIGPDRNRLIDVQQWGGVHWSNMQYAFNGCSNLNISAIDVPDLSNVIEMSGMFINCTSLNNIPNIENWDVSSVKYLIYTFQNVTSFNQPIGNWNTSNVVNMAGMFQDATSFNQPIGNWNTSNVMGMVRMFQNATSFNQSLVGWQLNQNASLYYMLDNSGLDCANYSALLSVWSSNPSIPINRTLGAVNMKYSGNAQNARNFLINNKGWTIVGDNLANMNCCITKYDTISFATACSSFVFNGQTITNSGVYNDTLVNANGCDSIVTLNLTINPQTSIINQAACNSYFFNGQTFTASGIYYDTLLNIHGCDSIITLNLTINQPTSSTKNQSACNSYFFNGQTLTTSGIYYDTLLNVNGCDSIVTLNLTINQTTTSTINQIACNSYLFNGQTLTASGTYYDTLINVNGCDSVIQLNLNIIPVNTTITKSGTSLLANEIEVNYQWISCNPYQILNGETNRSFLTIFNGDYAVIITSNGCTDTSTCESVKTNIDNGIGVIVYPNPAKDKLFVSVDKNNYSYPTKIEIYNVLGQLLLTKDVNQNSRTQLNISQMPKGIYYLRYEQSVTKVIVE